MRIFIPIFALWLLSACMMQPRDIAYCEQLGVTPEHPEYPVCLDYFNAQQTVFDRDREACEAEADKTYPRALYDNWRYDYLHGSFGIDRFGGGLGTFYGARSVAIPPDYQKNALVDTLRNRIIVPCMQARGWKNADNWQDGQIQNVKPSQAPERQHAPLPWLK